MAEIIFDRIKPDGTLRKVLDVSKINSLGWKTRNIIKYGIKVFYKWYVKNNEM